MNFAFPALLIVIYSFPGIIMTNAFLSFRKKVSNTSETRKTPWSVQISLGTFCAIPLHYVYKTFLDCINFFDKFPKVDFEGALLLLINRYFYEIQGIIESVSVHSKYVVLYFLTIAFVGWRIGAVGDFVIGIGFREKFKEFLKEPQRSKKSLNHGNDEEKLKKDPHSIGNSENGICYVSMKRYTHIPYTKKKIKKC